ncbi:MAG: SRPBCC domain-containing protein, partial [Acidimicrobiia bacterium]
GQMQMWFVGEYRTVEPPHRLVYTESMSDEVGNVVSPSAMGMPADHPEVTEITVELEDVDGRTRLILTHAGIPADSPGEMGWIMALDKLEQHLVTQ